MYNHKLSLETREIAVESSPLVFVWVVWASWTNYISEAWSRKFFQGAWNRYRNLKIGEAIKSNGCASTFQITWWCKGAYL